MKAFDKRFVRNPNWRLGSSEPFMLRLTLPTRKALIAQYDTGHPDLFERYEYCEVGKQETSWKEIPGSRRHEEVEE